MALSKKFKKIIFLFLSFWILPTIVLIINVIFNNEISKEDLYCNNISFNKIFLTNICIYFAVIVTGYLHRIIPTIIYYYNSFSFSLVFSISLSENGILKAIFLTVPHGITEILAFSIALYIGENFKYIKENKKLAISGMILIFISALLESYITVLFR
ncbi:stage II sporulation protein M [Clostridium sp. HBUAS56017]|uniref:stage II sporulation protein M n=1 Tax=Clostridium sp. HBUAS56017 TaxID=2571128 RepID=UPI0011788FD1|nr:stage II sporulation protein M [Clostridium sp. HBUAS56017]